MYIMDLSDINSDIRGCIKYKLSCNFSENVLRVMLNQNLINN